MLIVVSYDIPDDRRRTKLADAIKNYGQRVQYSVFECRLDAAQVERLSASVLRIIDGEEDAVRIYRLCADCAGGICSVTKIMPATIRHFGTEVTAERGCHCIP